MYILGWISRVCEIKPDLEKDLGHHLRCHHIISILKSLLQKLDSLRQVGRSIGSCQGQHSDSERGRWGAKPILNLQDVFVTIGQYLRQLLESKVTSYRYYIIETNRLEWLIIYFSPVVVLVPHVHGLNKWALEWRWMYISGLRCPPSLHIGCIL